MGSCINLAALDAVKNDLQPLGLVTGVITSIVINPQREYQQETCSQIEQEKDIYFQSDHFTNRLEPFNIKEAGHAGIVMNAINTFT